MLCNIIFLFIFVIIASFNVSQATLTFEDELFHGLEADRIDWSKHPCNRACVDEGKSKICDYLFVVESFLTMSKACYDCPRNLTDCYRPHCLPADGMRKIVVTADRNLPGPHIQVCLGDKIVVDVRNKMRGSGTTIHWHGINQINSPYMDGVPYVTQCPILSENTFRYQFIADQTGTYFWHSHLSGQRADGLFGGLTILAPPKFNPHKDLYDFDQHSMIIIDWKKPDSEEFYSKIHQSGAREPDKVHTILINGLGRYKNFAESDEQPIYTPSAVFNVKQGHRYRFRLVNAGAEYCPIQMNIDNHTMVLISADGNDIDPIKVDSINLWPGERYDIVINADQEIDNYWFRYRGHGVVCNSASSPASRVYQVAILRYESAILEDPKLPVGWDIMQDSKEFGELNPFNERESGKGIGIHSLKALAANDESNNGHVDKQFYIGFDLNSIDNYDFQRSNIYGYQEVQPIHRVGSLQFDHITFKIPPIPVLPQRSMITPDMLCNSTTLVEKDCKNEYCACTHTLQVKLNDTVELILVEEGGTRDIDHPLHLHGNFFRVLVIEKLEGNSSSVDRVKQLDREGKIKRNLDRAPLKDTVRIPILGYAVIRFHANNPGYWFFHCHFESHSEGGLALIFKVGEDEDMLPVPTNFPHCGHYVPNIMNNLMYNKNRIIN